MSFIHLGIFSLLLLPYFCQFQFHSRFCPIRHCSSFIICIRILQRNQTIRIYLCVSRCMCVCIKYICIYVFVSICAVVCLVASVMSNSVTPWTLARQAPLSVGFSEQEYWSGFPCLPPGDLQDSEIEPASPVSFAMQVDFFFFASASGDAPYIYICLYLYILPRWC